MKMLGYFCSGNARGEFVGGVGGPDETRPKSTFYDRVVNLFLKLEEGSANPKLVGVKNSADLVK